MCSCRLAMRIHVVPGCHRSRALLKVHDLCRTIVQGDRVSVVARCANESSSPDARFAAAIEAPPKAIEPDVKPSKLKLWLLCIKPPMYAVGIAPMVLAAALTYLTTGVFPATCGNFTLGGILVIAWLNLRSIPPVLHP
jgi:hypothetical protein